MQSFMSLAVLRGIPFFVQCEKAFLRDLVTKMKYDALDRGEPLVLREPSLGIIMQGTLVIGGKPLSAGQCVFPDILIKSDALLDRRVPVALTYCEVCCLTRNDIYTAAVNYPESARHLRFEAFKMAMFRSTQMLAQFAGSRGHSSTSVGDALANLGEDVDPTHAEVHAYFRAINGGVRLRGVASEQAHSADESVAQKAHEALELSQMGRAAQVGQVGQRAQPGQPVQQGRAPDILIDEDGQVLDDDKRPVSALLDRDPHEKFAAEMRTEMRQTRDEMLQLREEVQQGFLALTSFLQETRGRARRHGDKSRPHAGVKGSRRHPVEEATHQVSFPDLTATVAAARPTMPSATVVAVTPTEGLAGPTAATGSDPLSA